MSAIQSFLYSSPNHHRSATKASRFRLFVGILVMLTSAFIGSSLAMTRAEDFGVKEYDEFHHVLHALQHEALPKNDLATIRRRAGELIKLGEAIVKVGVPKGTKPESVENFRTGLKKFAEALSKYGADAESGSDAELKKSYSAVHESFEELAGMLPRK